MAVTIDGDWFQVHGEALCLVHAGGGQTQRLDFGSKSQGLRQVENSNVPLKSVHDEILWHDPLGVGDDEGYRIGTGAVDVTDGHVRLVAAVGRVSRFLSIKNFAAYRSRQWAAVTILVSFMMKPLHWCTVLLSALRVST